MYVQKSAAYKVEREKSTYHGEKNSTNGKELMRERATREENSERLSETVKQETREGELATEVKCNRINSVSMRSELFMNFNASVQEKCVAG